MICAPEFVPYSAEYQPASTRNSSIASTDGRMRVTPWMFVRSGDPSRKIALAWTFIPMAATPNPGPKLLVVTLEGGPTLIPGASRDN